MPTPMHARDYLNPVIEDGEEHRVGKALQHRPPESCTDPREPLRRRLDVRQPAAKHVQELLTQPLCLFLVPLRSTIDVLNREGADDEAHRGCGPLTAAR